MSNLGFLELINSIEQSIKLEYLPNAINWCDANYSNAWSNAIDRFDKALVLSIERMDYTTAKSEGQFYKETILELLARYKQAKNMDANESFLATMGDANEIDGTHVSLVSGY